MWLLSRTTASSACLSGLTARVWSAWSRSRRFRSTSDFDAANPFFDVFAVQEDIARSAFGVECERDLYLGKHRDQQRFVHVPVLYGAVPQAVQRYGPVHRSGVDEYVADPRGDLFRKSAFAAR